MRDTKPEPIRVEFEITNVCNAECEFCPRFNIRDFGYMNLLRYESMINKLKKIRSNLDIYKHNPYLHFPHIIFGGYGEPLIHSNFSSFIRIARENGFFTELITNGSLLSNENCIKIVDVGLEKMSISLHTLESKINEQIMNLANTKERITEALRFFEEYPIEIEIWRVGRLDGQPYDTDEEPDAYNQFLSQFKKKINVLGPTAAWNRGGQFDSLYYPQVRDSEEVRCHTLNYTLNISFNGDIVLCCCDFSLKSVKLAENWNFDFAMIQSKIEFFQQNPPLICQQCRKPKDNYYYRFLG